MKKVRQQITVKLRSINLRAMTNFWLIYLTWTFVPIELILDTYVTLKCLHKVNHKAFEKGHNFMTLGGPICSCATSELKNNWNWSTSGKAFLKKYNSDWQWDWYMKKEFNVKTQTHLKLIIRIFYSNVFFYFFFVDLCSYHMYMNRKTTYLFWCKSLPGIEILKFFLFVLDIYSIFQMLMLAGNTNSILNNEVKNL